ncbi:MAG: hypothetical protein K2Y22_06790 [Candidatus Obscuribacterales bacterium]|nr:hypothetical protein [Candidatus Obscuribacterales bacterium]
MRGLTRKQINHYLGVQPIALVDDKDIWRYLVSPITKKILGDIKYAEPNVTMIDTVQGDFPGDEVSNLNGHRINGESRHIRFPYLKSTFVTESGQLIIKRDQTKFVVLGWYGRPGKGQLIYKVAFRDRCFDGTPYANDCSLQDFPRHDPVLHKKMDVDALSVELSTYGFLPGSRVRDVTGDAEYEAFIAKPFQFIEQPEVFLKHFERAFKSAMAPGQIAAPIPDMARFMGPNVDSVALARGYEVAEGAASHYHVYRWGQSFGWRVTDPEKAAILAELTKGLASLKEKGVRLTRSQESWVCVLQSLPRKYIPDNLYLGGATWQHDGLNKNYLWMHKPLSERARGLLL